MNRMPGDRPRGNKGRDASAQTSASRQKRRRNTSQHAASKGWRQDSAKSSRKASGKAKKKKIYKRLMIVAIGIFIITATLVGLMVLEDFMQTQAYQSLAKDTKITVMEDTTEETELERPVIASSRDWATLMDINPDIKYWLHVDNKPIDYPLVQHPSSQEYYLKHGFDGEPTKLGTLFIDVRESPGARHLLTYGHHITGSDKMYSTVNKSWDQGAFSEIGNLTLEMPIEGGGTAYETFYPAFSFQVDQSYQTIQTFDFVNDDEFHRWLWEMANEATAKSPDVFYLCVNAHRALTFVTCASDTPNQRGRTLVIFIALDPATVPTIPTSASM